MKKYKKGIQLGQAFGAVLAVVLVAMLVIVGLVLFTQLNASLDTDNTAATSVNESLARPTTAGITLATGAGAKNGVCGEITAVYNTTNNVLIAAGNYSQSGCTVTNLTSDNTLGATWKYNYPYTYSLETAASNASNTSITQFATYPALIGLVGTVIFLGIVIGVLVMSFLFNRQNKA
jgi:hypothetical protein